MYKYTSNKEKKNLFHIYKDKTLPFKSVGSVISQYFIEKEYIKLMKSDSKIHL